MNKKNGEFYKVREEFEKVAKKEFYGRLDRDTSGIKGHWYQDGTINQLFFAFMSGYELAKCLNRMGGVE